MACWLPTMHYYAPPGCINFCQCLKITETSGESITVYLHKQNGQNHSLAKTLAKGKVNMTQSIVQNVT